VQIKDDDAPSGSKISQLRGGDVRKQALVVLAVSVLKQGPKMVPVRAVTTIIAPVVFRNLQHRTIYTRRNTVISTPARNKISGLVRTKPCRGFSSAVAGLL
jgi:hypothetical protein